MIDNRGSDKQIVNQCSGWNKLNIVRYFFMSILRFMLISVLVGVSVGAVVGHANANIDDKVNTQISVDSNSDNGINNNYSNQSKQSEPPQSQANKTAKTKQTINTLPETREQLYDIVTSDEYASEKEVTRWRRKTAPETTSDYRWLKWILEHLFGMSKNSSEFDWSFIALLLKALAIFLLVLLIVWIVRNASSLRGWRRVVSPSKHLQKSNNYETIQLRQSWEDLPAHAQIPNRVVQLLAQNNITMAASILYRGSLRWLSHQQQIAIHPATTELQCLEQIKRINQQALPENQRQYLSQIIHLWIVIAYSSNLQSSDSQQTLQTLAQGWLQTLPNIAKSKSAINLESQTNSSSESVVGGGI